MELLWMALFAVGIVTVDQLVKFIPLGTFSPTRELVLSMPEHQAVPGLFHINFQPNSGGAFSIFDGAIWLFLIIFLIFTFLIFWEYFKKPMGFKPFERWCIAAIYGGGLGNMIDRLRLGFVVDMIDLDFMKFAVFNVADCFITCGTVLLIIHLIFFNRDIWKDDK